MPQHIPGDTHSTWSSLTQQPEGLLSLFFGSQGCVNGAALSFHPHQTKVADPLFFRNLKNINVDAMVLDLQPLSSGSTDFFSVADLVDFYNQSLNIQVSLILGLSTLVHQRAAKDEGGWVCP